MTSLTQSRQRSVPTWVSVVLSELPLILGISLFLYTLYFSLTQFPIALWKTYIGDAHGFRQAQTLISAEYILKGGPLLRYETPVLGPPWSIPFEFPFYQWVVAFTSWISGWDIAPVGRIVSQAFFYASLPFFWVCVSELGLSILARWIFLSLLLSSPSYLFWSRTVMIESTALFFSAAYLAFALRYLRKRGWANAGLTAVFGALAGAIKATTWIGFLLAVFLATLVQIWQKRDRLKNIGTWLREWVPAGMILAFIPLLATVQWTSFADQVKIKNPLANGFINSRALRLWNFGTSAQRRSLDIWIHRVPSMFWEAMGTYWYVFVALGCTSLFLIRDRKDRVLAAGSLICFFGVYLIFTNLHIVHNYYQYANVVFFIAAFVFCINAALKDGRIWLRTSVVVLTSFLVVWSGHASFQKTYLPMQMEESNWVGLDYQMIQFVREHTHPDEVLLMYGCDWSSELPYYMGRRAIMDNFDRDVGSTTMVESLRLLNLEGRRLGAVVSCRLASERMDGILKRLGFSTQRQYGDPKSCQVYLPNDYLNGKRSSSS